MRLLLDVPETGVCGEVLIDGAGAAHGKVAGGWSVFFWVWMLELVA